MNYILKWTSANGHRYLCKVNHTDPALALTLKLQPWEERESYWIVLDVDLNIVPSADATPDSAVVMTKEKPTVEFDPELVGTSLQV